MVVVGVLHGPAVIGTDKPCVVEGCTGNGFLGTQGKLRKSGNEEEKVTMSARNVGEKSGVIVRASREIMRKKCSDDGGTTTRCSHGCLVLMELYCFTSFP